MDQIPMNRAQVVDRYFLEHRAKLIDIAAFLDRVDRASGSDDFRVEAFRDALGILSESKPGRAQRVLELLSDHSIQPIEKAPMKGALGAPAPAPAPGN